MLPPISDAHFQVPVWFDVPAAFMFGLTGALRAMDRDYDIVGVVVLAILTGAGGGLARDLVLSTGPPVLFKNQLIVSALMLAVLVAYFVGHRIRDYKDSFPLLDAAALAIYSVAGTLKGMEVGLPPISCVLVGGVTAMGGALLRDVITGTFPPSLLVPGEYYGLLGVLTSGIFVSLVTLLGWASMPAALVAIAIGFTLRLVASRRKWRTRGLRHRLHGTNPGEEGSPPS
jgi:uncharacterized membrane protein YeiH